MELRPGYGILIEKHAIVFGMSEEQARRILGDPDFRDDDGDLTLDYDTLGLSLVFTEEGRLHLVHVIDLSAARIRGDEIPLEEEKAIDVFENHGVVFNEEETLDTEENDAWYEATNGVVSMLFTDGLLNTLIIGPRRSDEDEPIWPSN